MGQLTKTTEKVNELLDKVDGMPETVTDGKTPVLETGTTTTLDPGQNATSEVVANGTDDAGNPKYKLNFGIPKGYDGSGGSGGGGVADSVQWANVLNKPSWVNSSTKPAYTASEVGALPAATVIPSKTSQLTNDSGFTTSASFKTVNGQSIVGSGNIVIEGGGGDTPSAGGGNVNVTNGSALQSANYYAFKPSADGSLDGTFNVIPNASGAVSGLMSKEDYSKLDDMKPVIALPIAVLEYNAETTSETIEAMLRTAFGMATNDAAVRFLYIASALQGEYNSYFEKFYIGDRECMLGGNVVTDGSSISQATLEFSYVDGGKLHTVAITQVISGESDSNTYTYSAKVLESGDDTYYLPSAITNLNPGSTHENILAVFGGSIDEVVAALKGGKRITLTYSLFGALNDSFPVSASGTGIYIVKLSYYDPGQRRLIEITCNTATTSQSEVKEIYTAGYPVKPEILSLSSSSTSEEISTAVGGESGLKAIIQAVKNGNRLFFKATSENDVVSLVYPYSVIYSVSDNGDMSFSFGYCMYVIIGFSHIGFAINYTKSSNTFTCDKTTA